MIFLPVLFLGWVTVGIMIIHTALRWRRISTTLLLGYLEQAVRLNLPIGPLLGAAAEGHGGFWRRRLLRLRMRLESGMDLGRALRSTLRAIPARDLGLIEAGERTGQLRAALGRLVRQSDLKQAMGDGDRWFYPIVGLWLVLVTLLIIAGGICLFLVPHWIAIHSEYELAAPDSLRRLETWGPGLIGAAIGLYGAGVIAVVIGAVNVALSGWRIEGITRWLRDGVIWCLPVFGAMARDRGMADACGLLADATAGGMPLPAALRECEHLQVNRILGRRLRRMAVAIEKGAPAGKAAADARLPGLMSNALSQSDVPAAMRFLERHYDGRYQLAYEWLASILGPAITLAMGLAVGWLVITLYLPLVQLADAAAFGPATRGLGGAMP